MEQEYKPEKRLNLYQRHKKYMQEHPDAWRWDRQEELTGVRSRQPVEQKKDEPKSDLQKMFNELKEAGVPKEIIDAAIDSLKEDEGIEELSAKLMPKKEETDQAALKTEYQERFDKIPRVGLGYGGAQRADAIYKLNREFHGRGMKD